MPFNTLTVACSTAPTVITTFFNHFCACSPTTSKPNADDENFELSYEEGVALIRRFLTHASHHTVEELQAFTAMYVPAPTWVRTENIVIPSEFMIESGEMVKRALGDTAMGQGEAAEWWKWREKDLRAEWIWVREKWWGDEDAEREKDKKVMLYIHGGAYYFGSVDEHRYQLQRHARKLGCRVFAPRYRLAPQFPFPCAIYDVLACYLYLLSSYTPENIIIAGDSAGAGMALSILCMLRDQQRPMPAGAVLISPWVDLCHSFPSVMDDNSRDYIPAHGFQHRPSEAWPPPRPREQTKDSYDVATPGEVAAGDLEESIPLNPVNAQYQRIEIDGKVVQIQDQIQMYTTNDLLTHPLVSPVNQRTLGGLCPLLVLTGGGEVLRDEQIYIAHKAAFPSAFSKPGQEDTDTHPPATKVWLQVFANACHVLPTLAWTKPAKMVGDTIASFAATVWSDPGGLAPFRYELMSLSHPVELKSPLTPAAFPPPERIGVITPEPVKRWMEAKKKWDTKYATKRPIKDEEEYEEEEENMAGVPPSAAYRRRKKDKRTGSSEGHTGKERGWGMSMWAGWSAKSDTKVVRRQEAEAARGPAMEALVERQE
ncbi:Similar to AB hydrolase superfamily protein C4A8.06c; acc. no. O14158 [Pyronema omphalodes CBS 100304]|uniref:Similar to AB hydrolase superfamily protein C4A8.06c acc. no. O14158 n=1 Tax=Pyronema omphalodes (strain CBS 100304) TaxID=1076935 RepID=U4LUJ9_PYROM|nr:Similar to AB hydrolase superfamily protein C4A8.06c; acc. no. O14158 [Pyronema omphalodes CBS 100304]